MECKCETCVRKDCAERTKQDDLRIVIQCDDYVAENRTNGDRIRAMSDKELAGFLAGKFTDLSTNRKVDMGEIPTATAISEEAHLWFTAWMQWLRMPYVLSGNYPDDRGSLRSGLPDPGMVPGEEGGGGWEL